jgi:hypothetical protein
MKILCFHKQFFSQKDFSLAKSFHFCKKFLILDIFKNNEMSNVTKKGIFALKMEKENIAKKWTIASDKC